MRDLIKMVVVLTAICAVSGLLLAFTNAATKTARELQLIKYVKGPSIEAVLRDLDSNPIYDNDPFQDFVTIDMGKDAKGKPIEKKVFLAKKGGKLVAMAYDTGDAKGYKGPIEMMVAVDSEGKIIGMSMMSHKESPGFGANAEKPEFTDQFKAGILPSEVELSSSGGKIDAISGATVTSKAIVRALKKAVEIFPRIKKEVT